MVLWCCLKKSVNWLCLINNDFNKKCSVHIFLTDGKCLLKNETDEKKMDIFLKFAKEQEEAFSFIHIFFCRRINKKMGKLT